MAKLFRYLVVLALGLYVLWFYSPYLDPYIFDHSRLEVWSLSSFDAKFEFPSWYYYLWFALNVIITIGLYRFESWSRDLLILTYIIGWFMAPVHGTAIQSPLSAVVGNLGTLIDGVVIGMAYFSPVSQRFKARAA